MSCSPQNGGSTSFNVINYNLFTGKNWREKLSCVFFLSVNFLRQSVPIFQEDTFFHGEIKSKFFYRTFWRKLFTFGKIQFLEWFEANYFQIKLPAQHICPIHFRSQQWNVIDWFCFFNCFLFKRHDRRLCGYNHS